MPDTNGNWIPADLGSALVAAYDPTDTATLTMSGGTVSQMRDISGNGYHLNQATSSLQPAWSATGFMGKPGLVFDGTDDYMSAASVTLGTTAFAGFAFVQQHYAATANARMLAYLGSGVTQDFVSPQSALLINTNSTHDGIQGYRGAIKSLWNISGIEPCDGGYYRIGSVFDGTNNTLYVDNLPFTPVASTGSLTGPGTLYLGAGYNGGIASWWRGGCGRVLLINRTPTPTERSQIDGWLQNPWSVVVVVEGDSKSTLGSPNANALPVGYSFQMISQLSPAAIVRVRGIGGSSLANGTGTAGGSGINSALTYGNRPAWCDSSLPANKYGRKYVLFIDIGSNDDIANTLPPATFCSTLVSYCAARRTSGYDYITVARLLSRTDSSASQTNFDAARNGINTIMGDPNWTGLKANGGPIDRVCDFAADPIMGVNVAPTVNSGYFADGVHPNASGYARLASIAAATINALPLVTIPPVITSAATATAIAGQAFSYQITVTGSATSYAAIGLPAGLSINTATGLISGTPL